jgi:hypothetical protein
VKGLHDTAAPGRARAGPGHAAGHQISKAQLAALLRAPRPQRALIQAVKDDVIA